MGSSFLGKGWKFPVQVDKATGRIMMSEHEEDIKEAIEIILSTGKGERVMKRDFGCNVRAFVFGMTDATTLQLLEADIKEAIMIWEPRVNNVEVWIENDMDNVGKLKINISYEVRSTNNLFNLVFPFYINEGSK